MFKIFTKKQNYNNKIIFISPDINSGGSENILFNLAKTKNKNDILLISLTDIGYYGSILRKDGYKIYSLNIYHRNIAREIDKLKVEKFLIF